MNNLIVIGACTSLLLLSGMVLAQKPSPADGERRPPREALAACEGQDAGTSVSFTTPRGDTLSATCVARNGQLVAVPEGHNNKAGNGSRENREETQGN